MFYPPNLWFFVFRSCKKKIFCF